MSLENFESLQLMIQAIHYNQNTAYFEIASVAVIVYDYLLTFKLEASLIWGTPWNIGKILFFLTRYLVFIDAGLLGYFHVGAGGVDPISKCRIIYHVSGWMIFAGTGIAEFILIYRTWAIWGQDRRVAIGLVAFLFSLGIPAMYLTNKGALSVEFIESPVPSLQRCFITKINDRTMLSDYLVIVAVETVILVFTLIKGVQHYRHSNSSLVKTLYKDGLLYYVYLTAISITNVAVYGSPDQTHGASLILLQRMFHAMFTTRILLHLRLAVLRDQRDRDQRDTVTTSSPPGLNTLIIVPSRGDQAISSIVFGANTWYNARESCPEMTRRTRDSSLA